LRATIGWIGGGAECEWNPTKRGVGVFGSGGTARRTAYLIVGIFVNELLTDGTDNSQPVVEHHGQMELSQGHVQRIFRRWNAPPAIDRLLIARRRVRNHPVLWNEDRVLFFVRDLQTGIKGIVLRAYCNQTNLSQQNAIARHPGHVHGPLALAVDENAQSGYGEIARNFDEFLCTRKSLGTRANVAD
jgi:hypothetical protein